MRWDRLFDDLVGQARDDAVQEFEAALPERVRAELAAITLTDRLLAHEGRVSLVLTGGRVVDGDLRDAGNGWVVVSQRRRSVLVPTERIVEIEAMGRAAASSRDLRRRLGLGHPLRALARDRSVVALEDVVGRVLHGTIDAVGADMLELARHAPDVPRRREHVDGVSVVPFRAIVCVSTPVEG